MHTWQMQEAKARLSEVVKRAAIDGPQEITLHGHSVAVVLTRELYDRLAGTGQSLVDFMRASPLHEQEDIAFERNQTLTRELEF